MVERDGDVMTKVVPNVKRATLEPIVKANVERGSTINTDELPSHNKLSKNGYTHKTVNHRKEEYVNGDCHVNTIEGFWSHLKTSITNMSLVNILRSTAKSSSAGSIPGRPPTRCSPS